MGKAKKSLYFILLMVFALVVSGCNGDKTTTQTTDPNGDTQAPVIVLNQDSVVVQIDTTFDVTQYISVSDNVSSLTGITVEVSDWGSYDQSVEGTYVLTIKATDEAGNFSTATITVEVKSDVLAPMITGSISVVTHLAGELVDLTKGLTGVDNVDGTNVTFTVSNYGDYVATVPGTYVIQVRVQDAAGNLSQPVNRTVIVQNSYTRAEMTSFEGDIIRFQALYNPQVFNGNTGTGYNTAYNGDYVTVLSKEYLEWLIEYAPERLGAGVGWSIVAVTNADDEIVYVRHWNSGEAYMEADEIVSKLTENWSTGTTRTWSETVGETVIPRSNARYSSAEMGLMLANINDWVPADGKVFIFLNWSTLQEIEGVVSVKANGSDMGRSMGANYIMNSDEDGDEIKDYALGRTLKVMDIELNENGVRESFDASKPFPIISIPSERYVTNAGIWKERYTETVYLDRYTEEAPFNPLTGIKANDGLGNDITDQVTYKIYRYQTPEIAYGLFPSIPMTDPLWGEYFDNPWSIANNEVQLENVLNPANSGIYFAVEYVVTANGYTDTAYRLIKIAATTPDYLELYGASDTVYSNAMGVEQRLEMNPELVEFGPMNQTTKGMIFDQYSYTTMVTKPVLTKGVAVVLNKYFEIESIRISNGLAFEINNAGDAITQDLSWTAEDLLANIEVPGEGYLLVYPEGLNGEVLAKALKAFYDYDFAGGDITVANPLNGIVEVTLPIKEVQEVSTLIVNGETQSITVNGVTMNVEVISNNKTALVHNPMLGGAGFRQETGKVYLYDKDMYLALSQDQQVVDSFTNIASNLGTPWFNNGVIMIFDELGNFVSARLGVGAAAEVHADGTFLFGTEITNWDVTVYTVDNLKPHGLLANILDDVPANGSFIIFPTTVTTAEARNLAIADVWNQLYPGGGAIVNINSDPLPTSPETLGFDQTTFNATYFENYAVTIDFVSTVVNKPAKIARPVISIQDRTLTWANDVLAASYDLYINGSLVEENAGVLSEDTLSYSYDLANLTVAEGTYDIQLRAIVLDPAQKSTSVLSDSVSFNVTRLLDPTNFVRTDNVLSWDAVEGATKYYVSINDRDFIEVDTNQVVLPDEDIVDGVLIKVYASGSETLFDSLVVEYTLDVEVIPMEIVLGQSTLPVREFIVSSWMRYALTDVGASLIPAIVVINNAQDLLALDDATRVFAGGYAAVLDSEMNVKYVVDRWGHEWNQANGWTTNAGGWTYGANFFVSYFRPYLAEGDKIIFASQYTTGLEAGTWRNLFGNALIYDFGVVTTDHRGVVLADAIDPSTVSVVLQEKVLTASISIGTNDLNLVRFDLPTWLNYIDPLGSNDVGAANLKGMIKVDGAFGITLLEDTQKIFAGGYAAILDENLQVKYVVDRWGHEWNAVDGWTTNAGGWVYGATLYASYFKPYLAEGDSLLLASQYTTGLPTGTYRNYFGNAFIKDLGTYATDHRAVDLATAVNPSNVVITIKETTSVLRIGNQLMNYREVTLANWMTYAQTDPGAMNIPEVVVVTGISEISTYLDTDRVFAGGYAIILSSDMTVKYIVDRWSNEWSTATGWVEIDTNWAYGANVYASYIKDHVAEGDILILGSQYDAGLVAGASFRDVIGNQVFFNLGAAIYTGDHRAVLVQDAIDPTTVTFAFVELE